MAVGGIVVRPVNDGKSPRVVYHLTANLDAIASFDGTARRDADVVDDFERARATLYVERFVHAVRVRPVEEARRGEHPPGEIDPSRTRSRICRCEIHACCDHAARVKRQEYPLFA